jgi:CRP/FNR family cyclic AMP-dependent transcriptional regulator
MTEIRTCLQALVLLEDRPLSVKAGERVFSAGDIGTEMFIVRTGQMNLMVGDTVVETVEEGGVFGEMALIDPAPRSASAVAREDSTLARVDAYTFHQLVQRVPALALEVMKVMARRLRRANDGARRAE